MCDTEQSYTELNVGLCLCSLCCSDMAMSSSVCDFSFAFQAIVKR